MNKTMVATIITEDECVVLRVRDTCVISTWATPALAEICAGFLRSRDTLQLLIPDDATVIVDGGTVVISYSVWFYQPFQTEHQVQIVRVCHSNARAANFLNDLEEEPYVPIPIRI